MSNLTKEEILAILNATDKDLEKYMLEVAKYRENNLITYSKLILKIYSYH